MAKLIYSAISSLDGYTADEEGNFDWAAPDEERARLRQRPRASDRHLSLRAPDVRRDGLLGDRAHRSPTSRPSSRTTPGSGRRADKVVYSRTLDKVVSERTRIERDFDPAAVKALKESAGHDISVGGPELAAQALRAGLVDELQFFLTSRRRGWGGTRALSDQVHLQLDLLDEHRFGNGVVYVRYRVRPDSAARTASA